MLAQKIICSLPPGNERCKKHSQTCRQVLAGAFKRVFFNVRGIYEKFFKRIFGGFTVGEKLLWAISVTFIVLAFYIFDGNNYLTFISSLIGATALIFNAKGNPIGQIIMIGFCIMYSVISYSYAYYGELITYAAMSLPMAAFSLISWLRHPFKGNKSEVKVNRIGGREYAFMFIVAAAVTVAFYFILRALNTANLVPSTVSVITSFIAAYLTMRRSPCYALGYAANDVVLIVLWILASIDDISYISMVICFITFLVNDMYGFINWHRMLKRQSLEEEANE